MRLSSILCLACLVTCGWTAHAGVRVVPAESTNPSDQPTVRVLRDDGAGTELILELPALTLETVSSGGQEFQSAAIPGGGLEGATGEPALPVYSRFLSIPADRSVVVTVTALDVEEIPGVKLLPVQPESGDEPAYDAAAYARDDFGASPRASVGSPALSRDLRLVPITLRPIEYNPGQGILRVASRLRVQVTYPERDLTNVLLHPRDVVPPSFDRLYRSVCLNYEGPPAGTRVENGCWLVICPNDPQVTSRLAPLVDWRTRQGMTVRVATTAETGTTREQIKAYIQNAYDNWAIPPEYIVLAGDESGAYAIPTWSDPVYGWGETDHPYCQLAGNDLLADAHIGRLSFENLTQLEVIVVKTVGYESTPNTTDPSWFTRACLVGDPTHSGFSCIQVMQWVKTRLRQIGYTQIDTVYAEPFVSQMQTALNRGGTIFCYRGYIGMSGWSNSNTAAMTNVNKLCYAVISTCATGSFANGTSYSEAFLRSGTILAPKAGIGSIGTATAGTHTKFNNCFTFGVMHGVLYDDLWEMGASLTRGKYELYLNYFQSEPDNTSLFVHWNNLMGDPACRVWTGFPSPLTANFPLTIPVGANSIALTVRESGGAGCAGAQVCLWKGSETYVVGTTDAQGYCELPVNAATTGTMKFTVTKHDRTPMLAEINVRPQALYVGYLSSNIDDDNTGGSQGNGDGQIDPGEIINLPVQLRNFGTQPAPDVTAVLSTSDLYVDLLDTEESFGTLAAGAAAWSAGSFQFAVRPNCPHNHVIRLGLQVTSGSSQWRSIIDLTAFSAQLDPTGLTLYNAGNGRLDPGETLEMSVNLSNDGAVDATGTTATLSSLSPWIHVTDAAGAYGTIPAGGSGENTVDRFAVRADAGTYEGHLAMLQLITRFNGDVIDTALTSVTVGQRSSDDPVGPDAYGYHAFDNTDVSYPEAPVYAWVELDPLYGGGGGSIPLGDYGEHQDKSTALNLPFAFKFYGETFDRVTVCSNGWMAMGDTYLTEYRNWTIPGAGAPQNLIAPFWDDLYETAGGGHVYQRFDAANHRWIVEWCNMQNASGGALDSFEAILFDPAYYPTQTGDGIIVFQYRQIANVDGGNNYATVGIQNAEQTDGLLYSFANRYSAGAAPLAAGRAIRFVPVQVDVTSAPSETPGRPATGLEGNHPNPFFRSTTISLALEKAGPARVTIYDVRGRMVRSLADRPFAAGRHEIRWDGADDHGRPVSSGVYFCRIDAGGRSLVQRMMKVE